MNKHTFILGIASTILFTACRKTDLQSNELPAPQVETVATVAETNWKSVSGWNEHTENSGSLSARIEDASLASEVVNTGLVLVYMKKEGKVVSLPYNDKDNDVYWHYQVSGNTLQINAQANEQSKVSGTEFSYFVLPAEKIKSMEDAGHSKIDLMSLTYENAATLLK